MYTCEEEKPASDFVISRIYKVYIESLGGSKS